MDECDIRDQCAILGAAPWSHLRRDHREWSHQLAMETWAQSSAPTRSNAANIAMRVGLGNSFANYFTDVPRWLRHDSGRTVIRLSGWGDDRPCYTYSTKTNQVNETQPPEAVLYARTRTDDNAFPRC